MTLTFFGTDIPVTVAGVWAFVTTVTTAIFYWRKCQVERSVNRAEKLCQILHRLENDDVALTFYDVVEHGRKLSFEDGHFTDPDVEQSIDSMLSCFSYLCYLRRRRVILRAEFEEIAYRISRTLSNKQIQEYLEYLYVKYDLGVNERPFWELMRYGRRIGIGRINQIWLGYVAKLSWRNRLCNAFRRLIRMLRCYGNGTGILKKSIAVVMMVAASDVCVCSDAISDANAKPFSQGENAMLAQ